MNEPARLETLSQDKFNGETEGAYSAIKLEINYNPYTFNFLLNSQALGNYPLSQTKRIINRNNGIRRIGEWFYTFLEKFDEDYNEDEYVIKFTSARFEIEAVQEITNHFCKEYSKKITLETNEIIYEGDVISNLISLSEQIRKNGPEELKSRFEEENLFKALDHLKENQVSIVVTATMSAGKSTLVNALLGVDLLPSKNEACTATICKITDVDGKKDFDAVVKNADGEIIQNEKGISLDFLTQMNEKGNEEFLEINLQGDIPGISSNHLTSVIVDTPGPNNSQNNRHKEVAYTYIKDNQNKPLIIYVLNATQLKTTDDLSLLKEISEFIKENGKTAEDRIIFVLNRIDAFRPNKEPINEVIQNAKTYLKESIGIENPKIFPMSAELAKLSILEHSEQNLDRDQEDELQFLRRRVLPDEKYEGIDTIAYAPIFQEQKDKLYKEAGESKAKASLHYSGLTALKLYINNYIEKTHTIVLAHNLLKTVHPVLKEVSSDLKKFNEEEISQIEIDIEKLKAFVSIEVPKRIVHIIEELQGIKPPTDIIHGINKKLEIDFGNVLRLLNNEKATRSEAVAILDKVNATTKNLEVSIRTSVKSKIVDGLKKKSDEIRAIMENELQDLLKQMNLSALSFNIISNKLCLNMNNIHFDKLESSKYNRTEVVRTDLVSDADWYNPFSWGQKKKIDVLGNKTYYKLTNFQWIVRDQKNIATTYLIDVNLEIRQQVENLKKAAIKILYEAVEQLDNLEQDLVRKQNLHQNILKSNEEIEKKMKTYDDVIINYTKNE